MNEDDVYQQRYKAHQIRKKQIIDNGTGEIDYWKYREQEKRSFDKVVKNRSSQRIFSGQKITEAEIGELVSAVIYAPSSCNRQSILVSLIGGQEILKSLASLLVGGVGWADKADKILLLFADMLAYKSPAEVDYMPYLDAGVIVQNLYLKAESMNIGACFVNPNIRQQDKESFNQLFNKRGLRFCGCMVLGKYDRKSAPNLKRSIDEIWV